MMKQKRIIAVLVSLAVMFLFTSSAFADVNFGNDDGSGFKPGTDDNGWAIQTDSGGNVWDGYGYDLEGLRITIYDAEDETKVFNTLDITGEPTIAAVSGMCYFADATELIPKTTWLSSAYVGNTYSALDSTSIAKYRQTVSSRVKSSGYHAEYVESLSSIDIISESNTSNYEAIKSFLGDRAFVENCLQTIFPRLKYEDFADGKCKIAFEPIAYFRYDGLNWALTATECALLNHYDKVTYSAAWNSTNNLRALVGTLTHSELPRAAFLQATDLGVSVYSPSDNDYYNGNSKYNSDECIIRCMGIGIIGAEPPPEEDLPDGEEIAEYHTDIYVYTSFTFYNNKDKDYYGYKFSIYDSDGNLPLISSKATYLGDGEYGSPYTDTYMTPTSYVSVYEWDEVNDKYKLVKRVKDGDTVGTGARVNYSVKSTAGRTLASGTVNVSCPSHEEAMGYFKWHTPTTAQDVIITITSPDGAFKDKDKQTVSSIVINAKIAKVEEKTPPDPKVTDARPSWWKNYGTSSIEKNISSYAPKEDITELSWTEWVYDWGQDSWSTSTGSYEYYGCYYEYQTATGRWREKKIQRAVYIDGAYEVIYTVRLSADMTVSPSPYCYTATGSDGAWKMKSGYGINISVITDIDGDTSYCTNAQKVNVLFPEFNFNRQSTAKYNRLLEKVGSEFQFKINPYSTYNDRTHFTPIWYPDNTPYRIYAEVFDVWCPAGQLSIRLVDDSIRIKGNVYDDWHIAPTNP